LRQAAKVDSPQDLHELKQIKKSTEEAQELSDLSNVNSEWVVDGVLRNSTAMW
jgi:hypothetical protein